MPILNTKAKARNNAKTLSDKYDIVYSDDGTTFSIYNKSGGDDKVRTDLMVDSDRWLPTLSRKKRLTTRYFQTLAEKHTLAEIEKSKIKPGVNIHIAPITIPTDYESDIISAPYDIGIDDDDTIKPIKINSVNINTSGNTESKFLSYDKSTWEPMFDSDKGIINWEPAWAKNKKGAIPDKSEDLNRSQWDAIKNNNIPVTYAMLERALDSNIKFIKFKGRIIDIDKTVTAITKYMKTVDKTKTSDRWYLPSMLTPIDKHVKPNDLLPIIIEKSK